MPSAGDGASQSKRCGSVSARPGNPGGGRARGSGVEKSRCCPVAPWRPCSCSATPLSGAEEGLLPRQPPELGREGDVRGAACGSASWSADVKGGASGDISALWPLVEPDRVISSPHATPAVCDGMTFHPAASAAVLRRTAFSTFHSSKV